MDTSATTVSDASSMLCNACSYQMASYGDRMQHYKTEWHRYNVKRRCAGLAPIAEDAFTLKLNALRSNKQAAVVLKCHSCNKTFKTQTSHDQHMQSNKHKKQASKFPAPVNTELVASEDVDPSEVEEMLVDPEDSKSNGDADQDVSSEQPTGIPLRHCLFCSQDFREFSHPSPGASAPASTTPSSVAGGSVDIGLQMCLDHMLKEHGFFIPFVELLRDLEGMLLYLGEKIGIGHVCLFCNGRGRAAYPSMHAVRQHMIDKCHCKIRFEDDDDDDEFVDFYDFPSDSTQPSGGDDLLADQTNHESGATLDDTGELILSNGTRLGHRSLQVYYRQKLKPTTSQLPTRHRFPGITASSQSSNSRALIANMASEYRLLALPGYTREAKLNEAAKQRFIARASKNHLRVGVNANRLQHHFRSQIMM